MHLGDLPGGDVEGWRVSEGWMKVKVDDDFGHFKNQARQVKVRSLKVTECQARSLGWRVTC